MAIADKGTLGAALEGSVNNSTGVLTTATTTADVGDIIVLYITCDNTSTTDNHDNNEISGITDSAGNTYTKLGENTNSPTGAALDGVTTSIWLSRVTTQLAIGGTITITYASNRLMRVTSGRVFTVSAGTTLTQSAAAVMTQVVGGNDFGSATFSGLANKERLYYRGLGKEANTTTALTTTAGYTGLSGGRSTGVATAITGKGEFKIATGTGDTSNPTLTVIGDTSSVFVALEELVVSPVIAVPAGTLTFTGRAPTLSGASFSTMAPAALVLAGPAPTWFTTSLAAGPVVPAGAMVFAGLAPTVLIGSNVSIAVPTGTLRFKGPASPSPAVSPATAVLTFTGRAPLVVFALQSVGQAVLALTGLAPNVLVQAKGGILVPTAVLRLTGQYVGQGFGTILPDALTITGYAPSVRSGIGKVPGSDDLVLSGPAPTIQVSAVVSPAPAQLVLTGQPFNAVMFGQDTPATARLTLTGQVPQVVIGAVTSPVFTPAPAALGLTGQPVQALSDRTIAVPSGSLSLTGQSLTRTVVGLAQVIAVPTGQLAFAAGGSPVLQYFYVISPAPARLRLLGPDPSMEGAQFGTGKTAYPSWQSVVIS